MDLYSLIAGIKSDQHRSQVLRTLIVCGSAVVGLAIVSGLAIGDLVTWLAVLRSLLR